MADYSQANKSRADGYTFDSEAEKRFYLEYLKYWPFRLDIHPNFRVRDKYTLGGYTCRGRSYKPDFVLYDREGEIYHVYDVKGSIVPRMDKNGVERAKVYIDASMRKSIDDFQRRQHIPVEIVTPMKGRFRMTILGPTKPIGVHEFTGVDYDVKKIIGM